MELSATFLFAVLIVVGKAQRFLKNTLILTMYGTSHKKVDVLRPFVLVQVQVHIWAYT